MEPDRKESCFLANGEKVTREVAEAYFEFQGRGGTSKVIFGEKGDCNIVGTMTLAAVELILDPLRRELKPLPLLLMSKGQQQA